MQSPLPKPVFHWSLNALLLESDQMKTTPGLFSRNES